MLELSRPFDVVTGRIMNTLAEQLRCLAYVASDVARRNIDKDKSDELAILASDRGRTRFVLDVGQHRDGDLRPSWRGNEHPFERVEVFTKIARVACVHRISLAAFDCGRDVLAADG